LRVCSRSWLAIGLFISRMAAGNKSSKIIIKPISLPCNDPLKRLEPSLRQRGITSPEKTAIPMDRRSMTLGISSRLSLPPPAAATPSHPPSPTPDAFTRLEESFGRLAEKWDQFVVMFHRYKEKTEKELQAAVRLQATARGFLARRQVQSLRGEKHLAVASRATTWPSSHEQAVVRLQVAVRGFLVRRAVRKLHLLISSSLHQLAACTPNHQVSSILFEPPAEVEIWVCSPPARPKRVVSFIRATTLVLDRPNIRTGWFLLHLSSNVKSAVQLFPWDPGGHSCSSNLYFSSTIILYFRLK
jgi:hypothetical protein